MKLKLVTIFSALLILTLTTTAFAQTAKPEIGGPLARKCSDVLEDQRLEPDFFNLVYGSAISGVMASLVYSKKISRYSSPVALLGQVLNVCESQQNEQLMDVLMREIKKTATSN